MQTYFWRANAQYIFANCVTANLDSQTEEGWGGKEISAKGVVDRRDERGGKEEGRRRGKKNTPARSHCSFCKLCSWANGVADWNSQVDACQSPANSTGVF